ncbi:MAG: amino acid permease [Eubacterium sp.]|jgi:amino acid permease|nr:amino acid permease [Eubacterium sp.]MCI2197288.1 amino acid permease [Eubacterium sp.]
MSGKGNEGENNSLHRGLKSRHLQMIAIGGSIGTGLFLAMGGTIREAGPGGAMTAYAIMGVVVYFMMTALGELATKLPIPGAFTAYANRFIDPAWGFTNGWAYWFGSSMTVAAESEDPKHDVPSAISKVFWRLLIFYLGTIFVVATLIPFTEPNLLNASESNVAAAPYTIIFRNAGFAAAASVMNAVILTSVLSCGNSSLYAASRTLQHMAERGDAPKYFAKISRHGVPVQAVIITAIIAAFAFTASKLGDGIAYTAAYSLCGIAGVYNWLTISLAHYRFRRGWIATGHKLEDLDYKSPFFPYGSIFCIAVCIIVTFGANYSVFTDFNWFSFITCYGIIPLSVIMFFVYKKVKKTEWVKYEDMDFDPPEGVTRDDISAIE